MSMTVQQMETIATNILFPKINTTSADNSIVVGAELFHSHIAEWSAMVHDMLINCGGAERDINWWRTFIKPRAMHVEPSYIRDNIKSYEFEKEMFTLLSPDRNYKRFKKTNSPDNRPENVSFSVAMDMHKYMVRAAIVAEFPELEQHIEPVEPTHYHRRNGTDDISAGYSFAICNKSNHGKYSMYMVLPLDPKLVLIGRLKNDASMLVFMDRDYKLHWRHKAFKQ